MINVAMNNQVIFLEVENLEDPMKLEENFCHLLHESLRKSTMYAPKKNDFLGTSLDSTILPLINRLIA